jgi:hypothetical protein
MIVIGIAPGLKSLTYAVLEQDGTARPVIVDKDVLLGPKVRENGPGILSTLVDLSKKAYVHHLVLEVVFERALVPFGRSPKPAAVLALGPPCNPKEPPEHVQAVRIMLTALSRRFGIPAQSFSETEMQALLEASPRESWFRVANRHLFTEPEALDTDDRKIVLAVAVALCGGLTPRNAQ